MPLIVPIIGAAASIGGALITSHAASNNANIAAQTAAANNALQSQIYQANAANEQPYIGRGNTAGDALNGFLGLGGDPAATQKAFQDYLNSTGYQFDLGQGINAAQQNSASRGQLTSGGTLKALDEFGTGLAQTFGQQYATNLLDVSKLGAGSANALAQTGQAYANASNTNSNSAATGQIAANNQSANAFSGALNTIGGLAGGALGSASGANAFASPVNNATTYFNPGPIQGSSSFDFSGLNSSVPTGIGG